MATYPSFAHDSRKQHFYGKYDKYEVVIVSSLLSCHLGEVMISYLSHFPSLKSLNPFFSVTSSVVEGMGDIGRSEFLFEDVKCQKSSKKFTVYHQFTPCDKKPKYHPWIDTQFFILFLLFLFV